MDFEIHLPRPQVTQTARVYYKISLICLQECLFQGKIRDKGWIAYMKGGNLIHTNFK